MKNFYSITFSTVASNNAQFRCNFVDLYYSLFGTKVPNCMAKNEQPLSLGLPKIPKISKLPDGKRSASPFDNGVTVKPADEPLDEPETDKREPESNNRPIEVKEEPVETIKV